MLRNAERAPVKSCRLNSRNACSKARTAARVPGEGGFLGGGGSGLGGNILLLEVSGLRVAVLGLALATTARFGAALRTGRFDATCFARFGADFLLFSFLGTALAERLAAFFNKDERPVRFACATFLGRADLRFFGADLIRPGLAGFLGAAFLAFIRSF